MDNINRNNRPVPPRTTGPSAQPASSTQERPYQRPVDHKPSSKRKLIIPAVVIALLITAALGWFMFGRSSTASVIDSSKYQAVFLTNGQVYFGKLSPVNGDYERLKDVYYLESKTNDTGNSSPENAKNSSDLELIKLGRGQIHGPEDEMLISKDQMLFFENLKPEGSVSKAITDFQKK